MMIVMPTLANSEEGRQPAVGRVVAGREAPRSPNGVGKSSAQTARVPQTRKT
jgi:hypothetical protein